MQKFFLAADHEDDTGKVKPRKQKRNKDREAYSYGPSDSPLHSGTGPILCGARGGRALPHPWYLGNRW